MTLKVGYDGAIQRKMLLPSGVARESPEGVLLSGRRQKDSAAWSHRAVVSSQKQRRTEVVSSGRKEAKERAGQS